MLTKIKAKECCCGCTLRTGSLILLWISLIGSVIVFLELLEELHRDLLHRVLDRGTFGYTTFVITYYFLQSLIIIITSVLGIIAVEKNISSYLTPFFYIIGYEVIFCLFCVLLVVISPYQYFYLIWGFRVYSYSGAGEEIVFLVIAVYLFCIALLTYFWIIIKSFRDCIQKNLSNRNDTMSFSRPNGYDEA